MCKGYQSSLTCYSICPDDAQVQLQLNSQKQNIFATCKAAQEMKPDPSSSSSSASASASSMMTSTTVNGSSSSGTSSGTNTVTNTMTNTMTKKSGMIASGGATPSLSTQSNTGGSGQEINPPFFSGVDHIRVEWYMGWIGLLIVWLTSFLF